MYRALHAFTLAVLLCVMPGAGAIPVAPADHPNHFILLVDSSASPRATAARAALFSQTLQTALRHMYEDGFEGRIPRFDPQSDLMTIEHFGATTGEAATAYLRLDTVDFLREFIRVRALRERNISLERATQLSWPDQHNRLTLLGWSRPLGVIAAAPRESTTARTARTFLIVVTDEIANDTDLSAELAMLRTRGKQEYVTAAEEAIRKLREHYRIGDADGNQEALWHYTMPNRRGRDIDAIELHEVTSNELRAWSAQVAALANAGTALFRWSSGEDGPAGTVTFMPTDAFRTLVAAHTGDRATLTIAGQPPQPWRGDGPTQLAARLPRNVRCQPPPLQLRLSALPVRSDPLLGEVVFAVETSVDTPVPAFPSCTTGRRTLIASIAIAALLLIAALTWWTVYTRYRTHVFIDKPAGLVRWRLRWNKREVVRDAVLRSDVAALRVTLPPSPLRNLLYRDAVLVIRSEPPDQFQWNDSGSAALPLRSNATERALVHWRKSRNSARAATLRIELHNRNRIASFEANAGTEIKDA